jgi:hypothetical protein
MSAKPGLLRRALEETLLAERAVPAHGKPHQISPIIQPESLVLSLD